ncbi:MAG TPA: SGNH/GDSL hydrolase family protein, partial [Gammaproteobacteria bacterium]|nr:SGNH/GDSL hydrolase family protein [Gammaproteobacteria bacterium]
MPCRRGVLPVERPQRPFKYRRIAYSLHACRAGAGRQGCTGATAHDEGTDIKREWLLAAGSVLFTVVAAVSLLRWLAPQLLGIPADLQLVQASETVPPFFENIFREQDFAGEGLLLHDPYTNIRFRPLLPADGSSGPHDMLGFRNSGIPNHPAVIVIGDSQTYGIGEPFAHNWPSQLAALLQDGDSVYSMAIGGWGAVQYLDMAGKAIRLQPQTLIIAFYTGNDPLDAFATAYGNDHWQSLRIEPELDKTDAPEIGNLLSVEDAWPVRFSDGTYIVFTPRGRLTVNDTGYPAVRTGYAIMAEVARRIAALAREHDISVVFTIIPTRELVYAGKVTQAQLDAPETYRQLVRMEQENIASLAGSIRSLPGARYVDLVQPLQAAALTDAALYPRQWDGHPGRQGYAVIARTVAQAVSP